MRRPRQQTYVFANNDPNVNPNPIASVQYCAAHAASVAGESEMITDVAANVVPAHDTCINHGDDARTTRLVRCMK